MTNPDYRNLLLNLSLAEIAALQRYAKNRVYEPFEGLVGLETLQETNLKLTSGIKKIKDWRNSRSDRKQNSKTQTPEENPPHISALKRSLGKFASDFSILSKQKFKDFESIVKDQMFYFLKRGLELTNNENYEEWIVEDASKELSLEIKDLNQIRDLSEDERQQLITSLYPYRSKRYKTLLSSFDKSVSVFLGALVATNLPGTGIIVSLVNMVKTVIRISNRINSLSVIYGYNVENAPGLFEICAYMLNSIYDWEKNKEHEPLHPSLIEKLYTASDADIDTELSKFIEAVGTKDLYIAIPGIGMLSLGKINLDNLQIDLLAENLIRDYFLYQKLNRIADKESYLKIIDDYIAVFQSFKDMQYFKVIRKKITLGKPISRKSKISRFFKSMVGSERDFESLSTMIISDARHIFEEIIDIPDEEKLTIIKQNVSRLLNN